LCGAGIQNRKTEGSTKRIKGNKGGIQGGIQGRHEGWHEAARGKRLGDYSRLCLTIFSSANEISNETSIGAMFLLFFP
jgi:hypothetical protein